MTSPSPTYHPAPALLTDFATGALDPARALVVATHRTLCPACAAEAREIEETGAAVLEAMPAAALPPGLLAATLRRIAEPAAARPGPPDSAPAREIRALPEPLRGVALQALAGGRFRFLGPGLRALDLDGEVAGAEAGHLRLYRIAPGYGPPMHTHDGEELTLVVQGAFRDDTGRFGPGDLARRSGREVHRPVAEPGAICFALAVTEAPLVFTGALGFVQRLLGRS